MILDLADSKSEDLNHLAVVSCQALEHLHLLLLFFNAIREQLQFQSKI